jgi:hypothetical protein
MTTIAAVQGDGWAVIGYDSRITEEEGRSYILPKDNKFRNEIINNISKKNIECHFIFENLICKSKNDFKKINVFFKLRNFTNS